jgi:pilus assembly protein CpaE
MAIYLLNASSDSTSGLAEQRIRRAIPGIVPIGSTRELADKAPRSSTEPIYLLVVAPTPNYAHFAKLADGLANYRGRIFFILISEELSATDYKALVRRGDADWVSFSADAHEILDIIALHERSERSSQSGGVKPVAVSFVPSAGGVGNTTLALETAVRLKTQKATRERAVCIIDLDFQGSHVCDYLDLEPRLNIQEIADNPERLDAQLFEIFISRHASGIHVFAAPRSKYDFCGLNVGALDAFFNLAALRYDLILVDVPAIWFAWTEQVVAASDAVIVTGLNTIPCLRQAAETLAAVRAAGAPNSGRSAHAADHAGPGDSIERLIAVAINRCRRRLMGGFAHRHHVETVLEGERVFYVGEEPTALESVNAGTPIGYARTGGAFAKEIGEIAAFCAELKSARVSQQ